MMVDCGDMSGTLISWPLSSILSVVVEVILVSCGQLDYGVFHIYSLYTCSSKIQMQHASSSCFCNLRKWHQEYVHRFHHHQPYILGEQKLLIRAEAGKPS